MRFSTIVRKLGVGDLYWGSAKHRGRGSGFKQELQPGETASLRTFEGCEGYSSKKKL